VVAATAAVLFPEQTPLIREGAVRRRLLRQIRSPSPELRKQAAWSSIERPFAELEALMVRGLLGDEPEAGVREAYVYSLGNIGAKRHFAAVEQVLDRDTSGYVRCAAWLAAARIDPDHFRMLAATRNETGDPWDGLGVAQAALSVGDIKGLDVLFSQARCRNDSRQTAAAQALRKWLIPLLDATGRAPLDAQTLDGQAWLPEQIDEIERRACSLGSQAVADDVHKWIKRSAQTHRTVNRINGVRRGLIKLLFEDASEGDL